MSEFISTCFLCGREHNRNTTPHQWDNDNLGFLAAALKEYTGEIWYLAIRPKENAYEQV